MEERLPKLKKTFYSVIVKRCLDVILSGFALVLLSPFFLIIAILEIIFHGKPVLYCQKRTGQNGIIFNIYKFRSMTNEVDENGELLAGNLRLTKFGKLLRKTSIDELPELFCIFKGDMSIIGPRPLLPHYTELYSKRHRGRLLIRPGLTCPWIKKTKNERKYSKYTWGTQFENDIWYVENVSFFVDIKMIVAIIKEVLVPRSDRVDDTREEFNGRNLWE